MSIDVIDLRSFYASPLGAVAQRFIGGAIDKQWTSCVGQSVLGIGFAIPYIETLRKDTVRTLAFMPAEQGVVNWPSNGLSASALVDVTALPLPDSCIDRVLVVHALEMADQPEEFLSEVWRVLAPGGRMMLVAPNRAGVWARFDSTPFGHGRPYSASQLRSLLRDTLFSPVHWGEALYAPPFTRPYLLRSAPAFEAVGKKMSLPGAGVHIIEATKQLYRPALAARSRRRAFKLQPAVAVGAASRKSPSLGPEHFRVGQAKAR
ncbi:MAG: class I SAM-dependent methyltransferase [Beijerinckiaceae bacterium]|nr:class I SAM-dependent methyltransferase [Beijerinckiaceae bacterium]